MWVKRTDSTGSRIQSTFTMKHFDLGTSAPGSGVNRYCATMRPRLKLCVGLVRGLLFGFLLFWIIGVEADNHISPFNSLPKRGLGPQQLAIIVNLSDPQSIKIAEYYKKKRRIPDENIIKVRFNPEIAVMSHDVFKKIKSEVDTATPNNVQAYALTWANPYRVGCMSITTAFAAGFDEAYCTKGCNTTKIIPYFNSNSHEPYKDYGIRPTMALAGLNFEQVKKLIDRGIASDGTFPRGKGYLLSTSERARNVRTMFYPKIFKYLCRYLELKIVKANAIENRDDVLFYFTGVSEVMGLDTNKFVPGAIADHLTSSGGNLTGSTQMSSLRWLEAGATGSYGSVMEPCNHSGKFPHPGIVISRYLNGASLIEAYWKSVAMPGQGIFIGEPLAEPYRRLTPK